jgi:hypothetical protein
MWSKKKVHKMGINHYQSFFFTNKSKQNDYIVAKILTSRRENCCNPIKLFKHL